MIKYILLLFLTVPFSACAGEKSNHAQWGYSGKTGPEHWAELDKNYSACAAGKSQSPVDIIDAVKTDLPNIAYGYKNHSKTIINNGHTIQVNFENAGGIQINQQAFKLLQVHFHAPSENRVGRKSFPLEGHFVHADKDGNLAVVAVMFKKGTTNTSLQRVWNAIPSESHHAQIFNGLKPSELLPTERKYYRFSGSLTTPPCSEGVTWIVLKEPAKIGENQIKRFENLWDHPNNRPVQPINARLIAR